MKQVTPREQRQLKAWHKLIREKKKETGAIYQRSALREVLSVNVMQVLADVNN